MTDTHEAIEPAAVQMEPRQDSQMHPLVAAVLAKDPTPETLEKLMAMQAKWEMAEAERLFDEAMVELKRNLPAVIAHDKKVSFSSTNYTHSSLANVVGSVTDISGNHGFSISWDSDTTGKEIVVACRLAHRAGHKRLTTMASPIDRSGSKCDCQARMSTVTMLQRYTLVLALGLATGDMQEPHGPKPSKDPDKVDRHRNITNRDRLKKLGLLEEAEAALERGWEKWTTADNDGLTTWVRERQGVE